MLKIGEFSKLSHLTVKALRFYEAEGILLPAAVDQWTGYRYYETAQLTDAASVRAYRQLGLSTNEIKAILGGKDEKEILSARAVALQAERNSIDTRLSVIKHLLEEREMKYRVTMKEIPKAIVYYAEVRVRDYAEMMQIIPELGEECLRLNPGIQCPNPGYEFCEYLDEEHRDSDFLIRHVEAVDRMGNESNRIKFKELPAAKVLCVFHKGPYSAAGEAYAYLMNYAEENGYHPSGLPRECYIDGIWNTESEDEWLTEIQLPIE